MTMLTLHIRRSNGNESRMQTYRIPLAPGATLLRCLMDIQRHLDATLNFTASCRSAVCGACAVQVNGHPFLACDNTAESLLERFGLSAEAGLTLEPLRGIPVISDLVVDWRPSLQELQKVKTVRRPGADGADLRQSPEEQERIAPLWDCMLCGACASVCQKRLAGDSETFLPPFAYTHVCRALMDSRTEPDPALMQAVMTEGLWRCLHCGACLEVCPKALRCGDHIAWLKARLAKAGMTEGKGYRHAKAFISDWEENGRLNEIRLNLRTEGIAGSLGQAALALRLLRHGKIHPSELFWKKPAPGHRDMATIIAGLRREENNDA